MEEIHALDGGVKENEQKLNQHVARKSQAHDQRNEHLDIKNKTTCVKSPTFDDKHYGANM